MDIKQLNEILQQQATLLNIETVKLTTEKANLLEVTFASNNLNLTALVIEKCNQNGFIANVTPFSADFTIRIVKGE